VDFLSGATGGRAKDTTMWKPSEHSDDDNLRWAHLRAMEWITWPLFISQPLVPILLYFYPWPWVVGLVLLITFAWRLVVAPVVVSPMLANAAAMFVKLRFAASPIMAFLIWQRGDYWIAVLALLWPFAGVMIVLWMVGLLRAPLSLTALGRAGEIGPVQRRFLAALGYEYLGQPRTKSLNDG
jgi:hypothetical protein